MFLLLFLYFIIAFTQIHDKIIPTILNFHSESVTIDMWILYVALFIALVWILDYLLLDRRQYALVRRLNHALRLPLIGHAWLVLGIKPNRK